MHVKVLVKDNLVCQSSCELLVFVSLLQPYMIVIFVEVMNR